MSRYTSFAVLGAGLVGLPIIRALVAANASVVVLTRSSTTLDIPGVKVVTADYNDVAALSQILKENNIEVVVSTVGAPGLPSQINIAKAAKAAGVKLFVPSEFGVPTEGVTQGFLLAKDETAKYSKSIGLPTARFYNGFFMDGLISVVGYRVNGKVNSVGKGDKPISWTTISDVAGFVAHVLTTLDPVKLDYSVFRLEGDRASLTEVAPILGTTVEHVKEVPGPDGPRETMLQGMLFESGYGSTGWDHAVGGEGKDKAGSANHLWENHQWKKIKDLK